MTGLAYAAIRMDRHARDDMSSLTATGAIIGGALLLYVAQAVNLPEQIAVLIGSAIVLGAVIGRWLVIASALALLALPMFLGEPVTSEDWRLAMLVYAPLTATAVAAGVALHRGARKLVRTYGDRGGAR